MNATWTAGDSLGGEYQPSLVSDPRSCSFDDLSITPTKSSIKVENFTDFRKQHISRYLELQYHGDLTVDCVESLAFPYDLKNNADTRNIIALPIAEKWKAKGVKVYYIDKNFQLKEL